MDIFISITGDIMDKQRKESKRIYNKHKQLTFKSR